MNTTPEDHSIEWLRTLRWGLYLALVWCALSFWARTEHRNTEADILFAVALCVFAAVGAGVWVWWRQLRRRLLEIELREGEYDE